MVAHPHLRIRHQRGAAARGDAKTIAELKLFKSDDAPTRIEKDHLQIWVSDLNYRYQQLPLDFKVEETVEPAPRDIRDIDGHLITQAGKPVRVSRRSRRNLALSCTRVCSRSMRKISASCLR